MGDPPKYPSGLRSSIESSGAKSGSYCCMTIDIFDSSCCRCFCIVAHLSVMSFSRRKASPFLTGLSETLLSIIFRILFTLGT